MSVLGERARLRAMEVAREVVEQHDEGQQRLGRGAPRLELAARGRCVQLPEAPPDLGVELVVLAEPLRARASARIARTEPEIEDCVGVRDQSDEWTASPRGTRTERLPRGSPCGRNG